MLELWIGLLIGVLLGFVFCFCVVSWSVAYSNKLAVEQGVIKLCGRIFLLEEIQQ